MLAHQAVIQTQLSAHAMLDIMDCQALCVSFAGQEAFREAVSIVYNCVFEKY